ncbi:uncharacterized protein LOC114322630 [Camellia sinensis]|uniref:uncharacterized protein LOC114322630 n=1 Tax=Camellia sinensis TaxID=4442 RepID=UPI001036B501|nr:uncharacterized protein LOC114322630 [Camellia sinensis]
MARALRESMIILRAETRARENVAEAKASFLTREFLRTKPDEFYGGPEPKKADEWLEQTMKTFEMLHIEDSELRVTLASYYLKGDAGQWWKYAKGRIAPTWEAFVAAFQDKYQPPTTRERLRLEFKDLKKLTMSVAGNMIRNHDRLVEAAAHVEITVEAEEERLQNLRSRGHGSQGDFRPNKKSKSIFSSQSQPQQSRSTFPLPSAGSGKGASSGFSCFKCGQPGHKAFACPQKGGGQQILPLPPPNRSQSQTQSRK